MTTTKDSNSFHGLTGNGGFPSDMVTPDVIGTRRLKVDSFVSEVSRDAIQKSAYGLMAIAELTPRSQITAQYGFTTNIFSAAIGGTITNLNSMFQINTGINPNAVVTVSSDQQVAYKSGQGLQAQISAIFSAGVADNTQVAGMISSESLIGFGYKGVDFGVLFATDGALEIQVLTITTGAAGAENATVTINGNPYTVPLTNSSINENAYEISVSLSNQDPLFSFASNGATVTCMGLLPELGGGAFTFTSATATGVFEEKSANSIATEELVKKSDWNVNPDIDINPLLGNVYKIQYQYLGFGNAFFHVENPETGSYELVHIKKYANTSVIPSVPNPIFRVGWATRNTGNTINTTVQGGSAGIFIEGKYIVHGLSDGECSIKEIPSGSIINILSIRNRLTFNDKPNRVSINLNDLSVSTEATKITTFYVYINADVDTFLDWEYEDEELRVSEVATNDTIVTGGKVVACYPIRTELTVDLSRIINDLRPMESATIAALIPSGNASDVSAAISYIEDL